MPRPQIKPGDTPFTLVTFNNQRPKPVKFKVTAQSTSVPNLAPGPMRDCDLNHTVEWLPQETGQVWNNVCSINVTIYKADGTTEIGSLTVATPIPPKPEDPRTVASSATVWLYPYAGAGANDATVALYNNAVPPGELAESSGVINPS